MGSIASMPVFWTHYAWMHEPLVPPDGEPDLEILRPIQIVRVHGEGEREAARARMPAHVRVRFVQQPSAPITLDLPSAHEASTR